VEVAVAVASVVAVVAAAAAVVAAAVADAGGEIMRTNKTKAESIDRSALLLWWSLSALLILCVVALITTATHAQSSGVTHKGKVFPSAQDAANALIDAAEKYDEPALTEIFGPDGYDIIHTGEPARDKEKAAEFAGLARTKMSVDLNNAKNRGTLIVGPEDWPFPLPIVKTPNGWYFDTRAGREELLLRRVGRNELDAIEICRGFVEAQHEYALVKKEGGVNQYAQQIISSPGTQNGLAWQNADGTWGGPVGEKAAQAIAKGYTRNEPFHGYFFKVLKGQGPAAPLGELDFVVKGVMIGGFALIAAPAQYRNTGVQTFMVSHDGVVYQKDLGPKTLELFQSIDRFNPDRTWTPVLENP
jgi:hypothetical protein